MVLSLEVAGWIVAGFVTLAGVLTAHWIQQWSGQRREDRLGIYEPLRRDMLVIVSQRDRVREGHWLWHVSDRSAELSSILEKGMLFPRRHAALKRDIEELLRLFEDCEAKTTAHVNARHEALRNVWRTTDVSIRPTGNTNKGPATETKKLVDVVLDYDAYDDRLLKAISAEDRESWRRRIEELMVFDGQRRNEALSPAKTPDELYDEVDKLTRESRTAYRQASGVFLDAAEAIRINLENALTKGRRYRHAENPAKALPSSTG